MPSNWFLPHTKAADDQRDASAVDLHSKVQPLGVSRNRIVRNWEFENVAIFEVVWLRLRVVMRGPNKGFA